MTENYIKPEDVSPEDAQKVLDFLNSAQSAAEIAEAIEIAHERDVGVKVGQHMLDRREQLGGFTSLQQVADVSQVGPERFSEIISTLRERQPAETATTTSAEQEEVPDVALPKMLENKVIENYGYSFAGSRWRQTHRKGIQMLLYLYDAIHTQVAQVAFQDDSETPGESYRYELSQGQYGVFLYSQNSAFPHLIDMLRNEKPVRLLWEAMAGEEKVDWFTITTIQEAVGEEETQ